MEKPTVFNRRLSSSETDLWFNLSARSERWRVKRKAENLVKEFLSPGNGICFVTSVGEDLIGGTAVYVSKNRLGMTLVDVLMHEEHREQVMYTLVKSSLPFFRSLSIREIDAIIPTIDNPFPRFPLGYEVPIWSKSTLEEIGFEQTMKLLKAEIQGFPEDTVKPDLNWIQAGNIETVTEFVRERCSLQGMDCTQLWYDLEMAVKSNVLFYASQNGNVAATMSFRKHGNEAFVGSILYNDSIGQIMMAQSIVSMSKESRATVTYLPLIGDPQRPVLDALANDLGCSLVVGDTVLMRKLL